MRTKTQGSNFVTPTNRRTYIFEPFKKFNLVACFSSRQINLGPPKSSNKIFRENRKNFLQSLNIDYRDLFWPEQVHKAGVVIINKKKRRGIILQKDAIITKEKNIPLAIFTADCLPIFLYDSLNEAIALIHAGWRGTRLDILAKTIKIMRENFNTQAKDLYVGFGPCIRKCCYEVGTEFKDYFSFGLIKRNSRFYLDLVALNKKRLLDFGVAKNRIFDTKICTSCQNDSFFSYRRQGKDSGRMMSVMMIDREYLI